MRNRQKSIVRQHNAKSTTEANITSVVETTLTDPRIFMSVGAIFAFAGCIMLCVTAFFYTKQTVFIESAQTAPGIVTELVYVTSQ